MSKKVMYWTGFVEPQQEAVSKEVFALHRHNPDSFVLGLSRSYTVRGSWRERYMGLHPHVYPLLKISSPWFERGFEVNHVFSEANEWHFLRLSHRRPVIFTVIGGKQESKAAIGGWRAEVFFPYDLLKPLQNVPPEKGTRWRANFYRVDYDDGKVTGWDWARVGRSFHEYHKFGTVIFD